MRSLLAVLVVMAGLGVACGSESDPDAGGARVVEGAGSVELVGTDFPVVVPSGGFTFTVSAPADEVPAADSHDGTRHRAAEGSSYIGVAWRQTGDAPAAGVVLGGTDPLPASLALNAGSETTELPDLVQDAAQGQPRGLFYVQVPDGDSPMLEVAYDGLVQEFDATTGERRPGPADGLYRIATTAQPDCPTQGPGREARGFSYSVECDVSAATAVPYVADLGWADVGSTWLAFDVTFTPSPVRWSPSGDLTRPYASYRVDRQAGTVRTAGAKGVVLGEQDMVGDAYTATYALPVSDGGPWTFDLVRTYQLTRTDGADVPGSPPTERLTYRAAIHATD